jgi:hypothetical protein
MHEAIVGADILLSAEITIHSGETASKNTLDHEGSNP